MHKSHINCLNSQWQISDFITSYYLTTFQIPLAATSRSMRQVLLFFLQNQIFWKKYYSLDLFKCSIKLWALHIYILLLHVKIKAVQKISPFSCFHYTSACFHAFVKRVLFFLGRQPRWLSANNRNPIINL